MIPDDTPLQQLNITVRLHHFLNRVLEQRMHDKRCAMRRSAWNRCNCNRMYARWPESKTFGEVKDITAEELSHFVGQGIGPKTIKEWENTLEAVAKPDFQLERQREQLRHDIQIAERSIKGFQKAIITQQANLELLKKKLEALG